MHDQHFSSASMADKINWQVIRYLVPYLMAFKTRVLWALALLIMAKVATVLVPLVLKNIVDAIDISQPENKAAGLLAVPLGLLFVYGFFRFSTVFFNEMRDAVFGRVAERTLSNIGLSVFKHLHTLDMEFHLSRRTGGLSRDIDRGTSGVSFLLRAMVFSVFPIIIEVLMVAMILAINLDFRYGLVVMTGVIAYVAFSVWMTNWRTYHVRQANVKDSQANSQAIDSLINFETVKYFNNEAYEARRYEDRLKEREEAKIKNHLTLAALNSGQALIIAVSVTLVMIMATKGVVDQQLTLGDFAMTNAFMIQVFMPLNVLGFVYREIRRALADVEAMFNLSNEKAQIVDAADALVFDPRWDGVRFDNVSFSYHAERPILKDVSFEVKPGQKLAIVGPSGAGKSTLMRLLFRFYQPDSGSISVGGTDISRIKLADWRANLGVVPQDTVLFNESIHDNIRYGLPSAEQARVDDVIKLAQLQSFVESLPEKGATVVGERGLKVSGGEKQRIAIARMLLKNPKIMIFDEATSSLDSASEQAILSELTALARSHTTLVIAHRLSTIVDADEIVVLDQGKVVERGTHEELLSKAGVYQRLWQLQQQEPNEK